MNIYEKMLNITNEMQRVAKNLEVGTGQNKYKATGEADVLKAVKELEVKYKVYSYPYSRKIVDRDILQIETEYDKKIVKGNKIFMRLEIVYRFVNIENPEEFIDITTYGDGIDTQDKAPGKAMTYGDKYALMKAYKIITGEDPDQNPSPERVECTKTKYEKAVEITDINAKVGFGKYKNNTWVEVYDEDPDYFDWLIKNAKSSSGAETYKKIREEIENSYITITDEEFEQIEN